MIGIAAVVGAVVVAGGVTMWLLSRPPSAADIAEEYLRALSTGDVAAIEGLVADPADLALAGSAFSGATSYITDYSFDLGDDDAADLRSVRAEVTLAGRPGIVGFVLTQQNGSWRVGADYLASLEAATSMGDSVRVGGTLVPAATPVWLLPAEYPVLAAPGGLLVGGSTALVTNEMPVAVTVDAALSPEATAAAQEQLDAYADVCAQPAAAVPANCGLRVPWGADLATLDTIAFRVDAHPVVALADDARTFAATGGAIVATATGTTRDGDTASFTYRANDWALRGDVVFAGDEMVLAVR